MYMVILPAQVCLSRPLPSCCRAVWTEHTTAAQLAPPMFGAGVSGGGSDETGVTHV